jgi:hypothetical protein
LYPLRHVDSLQPLHADLRILALELLSLQKSH